MVAAVGVLFALAATGIIANYLAGAHTKKVAGAFLYFRPVLCILPSSSSQSSHGRLSPPNGGTVSARVCDPGNNADIASTSPFNDAPNSIVVLPYYDNSLRYVLGPADLNGAAVATAYVSASPSGGYQVNMTFTSVGADQFDSVASQRYPFFAANSSGPPPKSREAIDLNGTVVSGLVIQARSFHGVTVVGSAAAPLTRGEAAGLARNIDLARPQPPLQSNPSTTASAP